MFISSTFLLHKSHFTDDIAHSCAKNPISHFSLYGRQVDCQSFAHSPSPTAAAAASLSHAHVHPSDERFNGRHVCTIFGRVKHDVMFEQWSEQSSEIVYLIIIWRRQMRESGAAKFMDITLVTGAGREVGCICIIDIIIQMRQ